MLPGHDLVVGGRQSGSLSSLGRHPLRRTHVGFCFRSEPLEQQSELVLPSPRGVIFMAKSSYRDGSRVVRFGRRLGLAAGSSSVGGGLSV